MEELKAFRPDIYKVCVSAMASPQPDLDFFRVDSEVFSNCPAESIDYALMEKTGDAVMVPLDARCNAIGSLASLWDIGYKYEAGNVTLGDVLLHDTKDYYVRSNPQLVAALGVEDLLVASTKDALLVANKYRVQDVKIIAQRLESEARTEWKMHR